MRNPAERIWLRADAAKPIFGMDEISRWADGEFQALCEQQLLIPAAPVHSYACPECPDQHIEEVTWLEGIGDGPLRPFIPCPEHGRVEVDADQLTRWTINFNRLAECLAVGLESESSVVRPDRVWHLASRQRPSAEIKMFRGSTWADGVELLESLVAEYSPRPILLLVPGAKPDEVQLTNVAVCWSLRGVTFWEGDELRFDDSALRVWSKQQAQAKLKPKPSEEKPTLQKRIPTEEAFQAYRLKTLLGFSQKEILQTLAKESGIMVSQPTLSRWIKQVENFVSAGGDLPSMAEAPDIQSIDPRILDMGANQDGRTKRQRSRRAGE